MTDARKLSPQNSFGVILIGRNEGKRLIRAIASLPAGATAVYVDSGSTDGSAQAARDRGLHVIELDHSRPFAAARARNAGAAAVIGIAPDTTLLQFMDGDCELAPGWLAAAAGALDSNPQVAVVCGRRRERDPCSSIYNRLMDLEWNTPIGNAKSCGGDALFRRADFEKVGGFDEACTSGEEPELCARLRSAGRGVLRIDVEMTLHDAAIDRFSAWWRRQIRSGHGACDSDWRVRPNDSAGFFARQIRSAWIWGLLWPVLSLIAPATIALTKPFLAVCVLAPMLAVGLLQCVRITTRYRREDLPLPDACLAALLTMVSKFPQSLGQLGWHLDHVRARSRPLIEYK